VHLAAACFCLRFTADKTLQFFALLLKYYAYAACAGGWGWLARGVGGGIMTN